MTLASLLHLASVRLPWNVPRDCRFGEDAVTLVSHESRPHLLVGSSVILQRTCYLTTVHLLEANLKKQGSVLVFLPQCY